MEKKKSLPLIYVLGMPIIFIVANFMAYLHLTILGSPLYLSVILYPLLYLISGLIVKKTDYKQALRMMVATLAIQTLAFVIEWALLNVMDPVLMIYVFLSFLLCQLIFIYGYDFLVRIKKNTYVRVFILVLAISILDNAFYGPIIEGQTFSLSILIRLAYAVIIPIFLSLKDVKKETKK